MNLSLRVIDSREEALGLAERLAHLAEEAMAEYRAEPLPPDAGRRFVERHFGADELLVLAAEESGTGASCGLCVTAPFEEPFTGEVHPLVVVLHVRPELRHRGIARALVAEARRVLRRRGTRSLAVRAAYNDDALISMGERWGFVRAWELMIGD